MENSSIQIRLAVISDINGIKQLHRRYQLHTISEQDKADGFVTTAFTDQQWQHLIEIEQACVCCQWMSK